MDLLNTIKVEYSQHKKFLYKKLTTYTMISIKNKVKENKIIKDNFKLKIDELEVKDKSTIHNFGIDGFLKHTLIKSKLNEG